MTGEVKLDGKPLPSGKIVFAPVEGGVGAFGEVKFGVYRFTTTDGPSPGQHRIEIVAVEPTGKRIPSPAPPASRSTRSGTGSPLATTLEPSSRSSEARRRKRFHFDLSSRTPTRQVRRDGKGLDRR